MRINEIIRIVDTINKNVPKKNYYDEYTVVDDKTTLQLHETQVLQSIDGGTIVFQVIVNDKPTNLYVKIDYKSGCNTDFIACHKVGVSGYWASDHF